MAFTYETVLIGSQPYAVYGDVPSAKLYLQASMSTPATLWLAADVTTQSRSLVAAVRWLDSQHWVGQPTDLVTPQALQWPRVNVTDAFGNPVPSNSIPTQIQFAEFELGAALVENPDLQTQLQDPIAREQHAGSVGITYFRPVGAAFGGKDVQTLTPFPQNVMDLIGIWLAGKAGAPSPVFAEGDKCPSPLDDYPGLVHGF